MSYKPEYSIIELGVDDISLEPSSKMRPRLFMKPGGREPGPDGDGKWRPDGPMPGDGARLGGVARPKPESVSRHNMWIEKKEKIERIVMKRILAC